MQCHYRPQRSCGKVMFLHLCVILFRGGLCPWGVSVRGVSVQMGGLFPDGGSVQMGVSLQRGLLGRYPLPQYGNKRVVHILLECTLVFAFFHFTQVADPGFPQSGGCQLSGGGAPTYDFAKFSQKLHKIERIWTAGGARPHRSALYPIVVLSLLEM